MSHCMTKPTKWPVRPAKIHISLGIHPVWSESSLSTWRNLGALATHWAHSKDSDQTGQMPGLICLRWADRPYWTQNLIVFDHDCCIKMYGNQVDRVKQIWYLSPMRAAKVQASLHICTGSPEPSLLAYTSSESKGTFRQKARSQAPLNGWACAVKICHDRMLEDTNSLDGAQILMLTSKTTEQVCIAL